MRKILSFILLFIVGIAVCQAQTRDLEGLSFIQSDSPGVVSALARKTIEPSGRLQKGSGINSAPDYVKMRSAAFENARRQAVGSIDDYIGERQLIAHPTTGVLTVGAATVAQSDNAGKIKISGFVFTDVEVEADVDAANGTISIPCQFVTEVEGLQIYLCSMDLDKNIYSTTDPITGVIDNGNIHIESGFGFFVIDGPKKGAYLTVGFMEYCDIVTANATMTNRVITYSGSPMTDDNRSVAEESYWTYARQISDNMVRIAPVKAGSNAFDLLLMLQPGGFANIEPQPLYSNLNFYKMEENKDQSGTITISAKILSPEVATITDNQGSTAIDWGKWCVAQSKGVSALFESSKVAVSGSFVMPSYPAFSSLAGEGTKESPYLIRSLDDYKAFARGVNSDESLRGALATVAEANDQVTYYPILKGKYVRLETDLDFNAFNESPVPIAASDAAVGDYTIRFDGEFDGNGHTITGFNLKNYPYDYAGFFGYVGGSGVVKNLKFASPRIISMGYNVAVVAAKSDGTIENIEVTDAVVTADAGYNIGVIAANNYGTVTDCTVNGGDISGLGYIGGISGKSYGDILRCDVIADIATTGSAVFTGGIGGYVSWTYKEGIRTKLFDCSYSGLLTSVNKEVAVGGIAGETVCVDIERCFAQARILAVGTTANYIGGVAGTVCNTNISDSYAAGYISAPSVTSVSGIVGNNTVIESYGGSTITNCYSSATVVAGAGFSNDGIAGDRDKMTVTNSYFDRQMAGFDNGNEGMNTAEMTTASGLPGFDPSVWTFTEGTYPRLTSNGSSDIAAVSVAAMTLKPGDTYNKVTKDFAYSTLDGVEWRGYVDKSLSDKGGYSFTFENGVGKLNGEIRSDTIFVRKNNVQKILFANIAPIPFTGDGTESSPWLISSKQDMLQFVNIANTANVAFEGNYLKMTADIDMEGEIMDPICKDNGGKFAFLGTFDGGGFAIRNLQVSTVAYKEDGETVDPRSDASYYYGGLFGNIGVSGVVKNLTIAEDCKFDFFCYGGAFAGSSVGLIENCENYATVKTYFSDGGGIVGKLNEGGIVRGCYNAGDIYAGNSVAGGIVGTATEATIENCANTGNVGAVYINPYQTDGKQSKAGGIVGVSTNATITNVLNTGTVSSYKQVGGIVGTVKGTAAKPALITGAVNYGLVEAFNDNLTVGQIAGENSAATISGCYFDSQIQDIFGANSLNLEGTVSLKTSEFIAGELSLDSEIWKQTAGSYPTLKLVEGKDKAKLASMFAVVFADNNKASYVSANATLKNAGTVAYSLKTADAFSISGDALSVTVPETGVADNTLIATYASLTRELPLRTLNAKILDGEGTQESPYLIKSADDMIALAEFVEQSGHDYAGAFFKVTANLDFKDKTYTPVATGNNKFNGYFDGDNKTISNIAYSVTASDKTATDRGLFGIVGINGVITNVVLDETNSFSAYSKCGGIAGTLYGQIMNCSNMASVSAIGSDMAGGIAGYAYTGSSIENCDNGGAISAKGISAAGILAASSSNGGSVTIKECDNTGDVTASQKAGGIAGSVAAVISDCSNKGKITATKSTKSYAGGIIAEALAYSSVTNCVNEGDVLGDQYCGGIVAASVAHTTENPFTVENCVNKISLTIAYSTKGDGYVGGIAGQLKAGARIIGCVNEGSLSSETAPDLERMGGIVGDITANAKALSEITDCHNSGDVAGFRNLAGIAGGVDGKDYLTISKCYNTGDISATNTTCNAGGITGTGTVVITDCWNTGSISGQGKCLGGITGYMLGEKTAFERNANFGDVTGSTEKGVQVGGLIGSGRPAAVDCYNFGNVTGYEYVSGVLGYTGSSMSPSFTVSVHRCYNAGKLTMEVADNGSNIGNAVVYNSSTKYLEVSGNWFDSSVSQQYGFDGEGESARSVGLTPAELCALRIDGSDAFDYGVASYPSLKGLADNETNSFHVARVLLAEGDTESSVTKDFKIGTPTGAVWTASQNLQIAGNDVRMANEKVGETATLTLTAGGLTRTYNLVLAALPSGSVDAIAGGKAVVSRIYYNLYGIETTPADGDIVVEKIVYEDGSVSAEKIVYKEN